MSIYFGNDTVNDLYIGLTPVSKGYVGTHLFYNGDNTIIDLTYEKYILNTQFNTLYNTEEAPIKSVILKGNTKIYDNLNNEVDVINCPKTIFGYYLNVSTGEPVTSTSSYITEYFIECPSVKFKIHGDNRYKRIAFYDENKTFIKGQDWSAASNSEQSVSSIPSNAKYIKISFSISGADGYTPSDKIYLLDSYGKNLYLTHLESVKMPVLKTIGKNLFDINSMSNINNWDTVVSNEIPYCSYKINLKPNTTYTFSQKQFVNIENVYTSFGLEKGGYEYLLAITHPIAQYPTTLKLTTDDRGLIYVKLYNANTTLETFISKLSNNQLQLEESSTATLYEPFKSNILTVNEDVTLRSNGDVYDELNLLTGRLTQRIDENNEVLSQEVVKTVDLSTVNQDGNNTELSTFNDITHVTLSSEGLIPEAELEVATKNKEVLSTLSLEMDDISTTQNALQETSNTQSENVDATMLATTEIYEGLL